MATLSSRLSQALHTYGTGSVSDFPNLSLIMLSPDIDNGWGIDTNQNRPRIEIKDERLAAVFGVDCFIQPPLGNLVENPDQPTIMYAIKSLRFPNVLQCPSCKGLYFINEDLRIKELLNTAINQRSDDKREGYICPVCPIVTNNPKFLAPVRFVIATEDGHLDDFPWDWFVHRNSDNKDFKRHSNRKNADNSNSCFTSMGGRNLQLDSPGKGPSLANLILTCKKCKASESIGGIFDQEATFMLPYDNFLRFNGSYLGVPHKGNTSTKNAAGAIIRFDFWRDPLHANTDSNELVKKRKNINEWNEIKAKYPRTLQRGAGNIYFPVSFKGISLPDYQITSKTPFGIPEKFLDILVKMLEHHSSLAVFSNDQEKINFLRNLNDNSLSEIFAYNYSASILREYFNIRYPMPDAPTNAPMNKKIKLRKEEFDCFLNTFKKVPEDFWYESRIISGDDTGEIKSFIDSIVLFDKIREVRVLKGFTRIRPLAFDELIFIQNENEIDQKYRKELGRIRDVRMNDGAHNRKEKDTTPWLPGIEVKGEGIFLKFNDDKLTQWQCEYPQINERIKRLQKNYINSLKSFGSLPDDFNDEVVNARYVLLHTISHILIDALVSDSGYNAASLSELIYCSQDTDDNKMNGILIYTSSADAEGTLGGLVEQGKSKNINRLMRKAVEKARWCSSDPLCIETEQGQGFLGVNLAACHSCCMLPETSCENLNKFLDRALLVGSLSHPEFGFFKHIQFF